jgi:hypothetical protein
MTLEEMIETRIPAEHRNYCAHKYVDVMKCYRDVPYRQRLFKKACEPVWDEYKHCRYELWVYTVAVSAAGHFVRLWLCA